MIFDNINVRTELVKERKKSNELLDDVNELLNIAARNDEDILQRLRKSEGNSSNVEVDVNAADRIFTIEQIRKTCIRYRLRFLPTQHFKADFPYEVIAEINSLEKKLNQKIENFRIIAPSEAFDLENINKDPLLFAELSDGNYYLIHQWGKDLKWYRRILTWPLQNFKTYFISLWILAAALVFAIPSSVMNQFTQESENVLRIWLTIHTFIAFMGITFWAALTFEKTFSSLNWESKYYNW
jgi:hypothetical protein